MALDPYKTKMIVLPAKMREQRGCMSACQPVFAIGESNLSRSMVGNIPGFEGGAWLIGSGNKAESRFKQYVFQIGIRTQTNASNCFVIGTGPSGGGYLNFTRPNSLGVGFNSNKPTFYVGPATVSTGYGKVGVGTVNPTVMFEVGEETRLGVNSTGSQTSLTVLKHGQGQTAKPVLSGPALLVTKPSQVTSQYGPNDQTGIVRISGFTPNNTTAAINVQDRLYITTSGRLGINNSSPRAELDINGDLLVGQNGTVNAGLFSNGHFRCRSILVDLQPIPDYVFDPNYKLMTLPELKTFIDKNKHLPNIKSSCDYQKDGFVDVLNLELKLLEKIEELTLYIIQLEEKLAKHSLIKNE